MVLFHKTHNGSSVQQVLRFCPYVKGVLVMLHFLRSCILEGLIRHLISAQLTFAGGSSEQFYITEDWKPSQHSVKALRWLHITHSLNYF